MSILLSHSSLDFKKNEVKTLEVIHTRGFFSDDFSELAGAISSAYDKHRGIKKGTFDFNFVSDFDVVIEKKSHRIIIHASAIGDYQFTTYSIGICSTDNSNELIRRFHFDYVHKNGGKDQKVPVSHLQYGGKSGVGFSGMIYNTDKIE